MTTCAGDSGWDWNLAIYFPSHHGGLATAIKQIPCCRSPTPRSRHQRCRQQHHHHPRHAHAASDNRPFRRAGFEADERMGGTKASCASWYGLPREYATAEDLRLTSAGVLVGGRRRARLKQDNKASFPILAESPVGTRVQGRVLAVITSSVPLSASAFQTGRQRQRRRVVEEVELCCAVLRLTLVTRSA